MRPDGMEVRGGAAGLAADLAAMQSAADLLRTVSVDLTVAAVAVAALAAESASSRTALLDPVGLLDVEHEFVLSLAGPVGLVGCAARLAALASGLSTAAALYAQTERVTASVMDGVRDRVAETAGAGALVAVTAGLPGTAVAVSAGASTWVAWRAVPLLRAETVLALGDVVEGGFRLDSLDDRYHRLTGRQRAVMRDDVLTGRDDVLAWLAAHPAVAEQLVTGAPAFLDGLTGPLVVPGRLPVRGRGPAGGVGDGLVWPPEDPRELARLLSALGAVSPLLVDGRVEVRRLTSSRSAGSPPTTTGVTGALQRLAPYASGEPALTSRVRVERIQRGPSTSWSVYIPPTQTWRLDGGANPFDGSTNVRSAGGQPTAAARAVTQALQASGTRRGEPVMLSGYSQGGLTAAQLAADPDFRDEFSVSTVLTVGAPVAGFDLPDDVQVLSIEHEQDLVPVLDDGRNPDRENWTTVRRDLAVAGPLATTWVDDVEQSPFAGHHLHHYLDTAQLVDASTDGSVVAWQRAAAPFLDTTGADVEVAEWQARRVDE